MDDYCKYKVGDKVRILKRKYIDYYYPYTFTDEMASYAGRIFTISNIESNPYISEGVDSTKYRGYEDVLPFVFWFEEDNDQFRWVSTEFEKVNNDDKIDLIF